MTARTKVSLVDSAPYLPAAADEVRPIDLKVFSEASLIKPVLLSGLCFLCEDCGAAVKFDLFFCNFLSSLVSGFLGCSVAYDLSASCLRVSEPRCASDF